MPHPGNSWGKIGVFNDTKFYLTLKESGKMVEELRSAKNESVRRNVLKRFKRISQNHKKEIKSLLVKRNKSECLNQ